MELLLLVGGWLAMKTKLLLFSSAYCTGSQVIRATKSLQLPVCSWCINFSLSLESKYYTCNYSDEAGVQTFLSKYHNHRDYLQQPG